MLAYSHSYTAVCLDQVVRMWAAYYANRLAPLGIQAPPPPPPSVGTLLLYEQWFEGLEPQVPIGLEVNVFEVEHFINEMKILFSGCLIGTRCPILHTR
jgi:hypothetical protein